MIYLDHAATTSLSDAALQTFIDISKECYGNPSSIHWAGRKAQAVLRQARLDIAQALEVKSDSIIFTSGGSEADTLAIQGYALAHQHQGKHLITTAIEHHAVLHTMEYLAERFGFEVTYIEPINQVISAQQIKEALRPDTILVSVMYANNETGLLLPIQEIGDILTNHQAVFHVDAVQAIGKLPISPGQLGIDFLSATAHKFHGPKGVGFLYSRIANFDSLIHGGRQEELHRAGTENLAGIAAMATALKEQTAQLEHRFQIVADLKTYLLKQLTAIDHYLNEAGPSLPHILNIGFPNQLNEQLLMRLDLAGIAVSSGSACTAGVIQASHVLEALYGQNSQRLRESIRISLSHETTKEELDVLVQQLHTIIGGTY